MAKATPNKKKQPAEVETLRETIAKTKAVEQPKKEEVKEKTAEKVEKIEKTDKIEKIEKVEKKSEAVAKPKKQTNEAVLDVEDLTGAMEEHKTRKKPVMTALIALLTVLIVVGLTLWFLYWGANHRDEQEELPQPSDNSQVEEDKDEIKIIEETDYVENIVGANGVALEPVYYLGTKDNFTLKFTNLNCDDTCSNVDEVKIGGKTLTSGVDYIVKREDGVTVVVYAAALNKYEAGDNELTFRILQEKYGRKELRTIGVKFEIKKAITCGDNQVVQNGQCVDKTQVTKPEEKPVDSEQAKCEAQEGPDYVYQVHWYTDDEKAEVIKDYGYDNSVIVSVVRGDFVGDKNGTNSAGMKLVNGVCRPNPNATAVTAGEKSYTESNLSSIDSKFAALVMGNERQDILVYAWKTDSGNVNYRMELLK